MNDPEKNKNLTFEEAIKFLRQGKKITRNHPQWNRFGFDKHDAALFFDAEDLLANDWMVIENG
jgi:hypothetical protein